MTFNSSNGVGGAGHITNGRVNFLGMCVIYLAFEYHPRYPLILAANRDEYYDRPTAPAGKWEDEPEIYAGRDLISGGTWLGVTTSGRFAAVTNFRDPLAPTGSHSRGTLVADFLRSDQSPADYLKKVLEKADAFSGFNLFIGRIDEDVRELFYLSSRGDGVTQLASGIYGLSNNLLDVPWPKVTKGKARFEEIVSGDNVDSERLFTLLSDEATAPEWELPHTGISPAREKALSAIFIKTPDYGTRSSTVLTIGTSLIPEIEERVFV